MIVFFPMIDKYAFYRLVNVFYVDLAPYLDRCLKVAFPPAQVARVMGGGSKVCQGLNLDKLHDLLPKNSRPEKLVLPPVAASVKSEEMPNVDEPTTSFVIDRVEIISQEIDSTTISEVKSDQ